MEKFVISMMFFLFFISLNSVYASYDLSLEIEAQNFSLGNSSEYKIIVKNLNYTQGQDYIYFTLEYWINKENKTLIGYPKETSDKLKKQKTIKRSFTPDEPGIFMICANITNSSEFDFNKSNNFLCKKISVNGSVNKENKTNENKSGNKILIDFPHYVLNGNVFIFSLNLSGFKDGFYDVKIDIKNFEERISKIWDPKEQEWRSTFYYLNNALEVVDNKTFSLFYLKIDCNCSGPSDLEFKLRKDSKIFSLNSEINVLNFNFEGNENKKNESESEKNEMKNESEIKILDIDKEVKFGSIVNVKFFVYRGNTRKYAIYVSIKNRKRISEESIIYLKTKYTNYTLKIPIQLKTNCDYKYENGTYYVVVSGLGKEDKKEIKVIGINNKECYKKNSENLKGKKEEKKAEVSSDSINVSSKFQPNQILGSVIYENKREKLKGKFWILFVILSFLISIVVLIKRKEI